MKLRLKRRVKRANQWVNNWWFYQSDEQKVVITFFGLFISALLFGLTVLTLTYFGALKIENYQNSRHEHISETSHYTVQD